MTHNAEFMFDTAVMLMRAGRRADAGRAAWEVVRRNPGHADAWALRARLEAEAGRYENAMLHHGFALQAAPNRHDLWCNRAIDAMSARMHREAEEGFRRSLALKDTFEGHYNFGNLLSSQMRTVEAIEQYRAALALDDTDAQPHVNLGQALIAEGSWQEGFAEYRHRFNSIGFPPAPRLNWPKWQGEPLDGKTILLHVEQGFGDEIMSLRFAQAVRDWCRNCHIILAVRPPVYRLARQSYDNVIMMYDEPPRVPDYQCALLDVPGYIDLTPATLPLKGGYLKADDRGYRLEFPPGLKVGICWAAGARDLQPGVAETARQKTLAFGQLAGVLARPGVNLVSLQQKHGDGAALRDLGVHDPMAGVTDFADTAWIISQLDLVITVDTSVAHLAGALGVPCWNLVRFDGLWPWMRQDRETCWYDSMTLYRQPQAYDWDEPLKRLTADFDVLVARKAAA